MDYFHVRNLWCIGFWYVLLTLETAPFSISPTFQWNLAMLACLCIFISQKTAYDIDLKISTYSLHTEINQLTTFQQNLSGPPEDLGWVYMEWPFLMTIGPAALVIYWIKFFFHLLGTNFLASTKVIIMWKSAFIRAWLNGK